MNSAEDGATEQTGKPRPADSAEQFAHELYRFAAAEMAVGHQDEALCAMLTERGMTAESAAVVVKTLRDAESAERLRAGTRNMSFGAFLCIGGAAVTTVTYLTATSTGGGGTVVIFWGAILIGAFQFIFGAMQRFL